MIDHLTRLEHEVESVAAHHHRLGRTDLWHGMDWLSVLSGLPGKQAVTRSSAPVLFESDTDTDTRSFVDPTNSDTYNARE
jgi:hypothetical protein